MNCKSSQWYNNAIKERKIRKKIQSSVLECTLPYKQWNYFPLASFAIFMARIFLSVYSTTFYEKQIKNSWGDKKHDRMRKQKILWDTEINFFFKWKEERRYTYLPKCSDDCSGSALIRLEPWKRAA